MEGIYRGIFDTVKIMVDSSVASINNYREHRRIMQNMNKICVCTQSVSDKSEPSCTAEQYIAYIQPLLS